MVVSLLLNKGILWLDPNKEPPFTLEFTGDSSHSIFLILSLSLCRTHMSLPNNKLDFELDLSKLEASSVSHLFRDLNQEGKENTLIFIIYFFHVYSL